MPAVARVGDACVPHCSPFTVNQGSGDVFVNGKALAFVGGTVSSHAFPAGSACPPHAPTIATGSSSVFVNGKAVAIVGSRITSCTSISAGSPDVFVPN